MTERERATELAQVSFLSSERRLTRARRHAGNVISEVVQGTRRREREKNVSDEKV